MRALFSFLVISLVVSFRALSKPIAVTEFPNPPDQGKVWSVPAAGFPTNLLSAIDKLFEQGFPDPRGCEYREVQVVVSGVWEGPHQVATHAWVLPGTNAAQQYAICWNGLIYPVTEVGPMADLPAEAAHLAPPSARRFNLGLGEIRSVFSTNSPPTRVLLLLRAGQTDIALKNWVPDEQTMSQIQIRRNQAETEIGKLENYDPYLELTEDWVWAQFDRVLCAHMRGDVSLALAGARQISKLAPEIEAEDERRGFAHPPYSDTLKHDQPRPYLHFLDQLPSLLGDLERRAQNLKQATTIQMGLTSVTDHSKRIAALIEDLDMVQARQMSQPGSVNPEDDPIVQALIAEGDAAVEPLLTCLEKDNRLTRSVGYSRNFQRNRTVISVASAARAALQEILHVQFRTAPEFRNYWMENKGKKLEDRWFSTLRDDHADIEQWLQAVANIMQPEDIVGVAGAGHYTVARVSPRGEPKMRGEVLRGKQNPSVTDLLLKRANQLSEQANQKDQFTGVESLRNGTKFVVSLSQWDKPATAVPPATSLMRRAIELFDDPNSFIMSSGHDLSHFIPQLTKTRVDGGDTSAVTEYANWIRSAEPKKLDIYALDAFEPLWRSSNTVAFTSAADWLFNDPASPWSSLPWNQIAAFRDPLQSDLVNLPAFRRLILRALDSREVIGTMEYSQGDVVSYDIKDYGRGSRGPVSPANMNRPAVGTKVDIRRCDWIAWTLVNAKRIPSFNAFAPIEKRDEAIRQAKAALSQNQ